MPVDKSSSRFSHLLGRYEDSARKFYDKMLLTSKNEFEYAVPMQMSLLTQNTLRAINYDIVKEKRLQNYLSLSSMLPNNNPFNHFLPECPFAYPFCSSKGPSLRSYLSDRNIFIPTNWSYLTKLMPPTSLEYEWSCNILPLPIDQRYGFSEMKEIASAIKTFF